ncbi:MAG: sensor histidine kinase [Methyloceanibacter sp.]
MFFARLFRLLRTTGFGLGLLYATLFATSAVILGCIVYWTVQSLMDQQLSTRIDWEVRVLKDELRSEGADELIRGVQKRTTYAGNLEYFLADAHGFKLAGNLPSMPSTLGWSDLDIPDEGHANQIKYLRLETVDLDNGFRLAVGDDLGSKNDIRRAFFDALVWAILAFLVLTLAGGLLLSTLFLRRVNAIVQTVETIIEGNLDSRVPLRGTDDHFDRLSVSLNRMLNRIQLLMESLSQVSNDIAHALRTPLGRLQQKLEMARLNAGENPKCKKTIDGAVDETENILDTFSALLRIAQIESGTRTAGFRELDLSNLFETVSGAYSAAAEDQGKPITVEISSSLEYWGDPDLLAEMLANLIDNALRHTPPEARIEVSLTQTDSQLIAIVADDGPGVPQTERDRIFRRFYRLEHSFRTPGNGLGLSLVAAVAELHSIKLSVDDNAPGLRVTMKFGPILPEPRTETRRARGESPNRVLDAPLSAPVRST